MGFLPLPFFLLSVPRMVGAAICAVKLQADLTQTLRQILAHWCCDTPEPSLASGAQCSWQGKASTNATTTT